MNSFIRFGETLQIDHGDFEPLPNSIERLLLIRMLSENIPSCYCYLLFAYFELFLLLLLVQ